ncbi:hypothetical protein PLICRDRAFT_567923 [Plicaturopsis crispa FD-325 SS-3]|nr:hypothetical protein PLICRDRAFT_567923 [Plicaturopsis crispa FD-325 SS-3]
MPGQYVSRPNPPPDPSQLPESVLQCSSRMTEAVISANELLEIQKFRRAADYIAAAMIFLKTNVFMEERLSYDMIKARLLGHWGTCPGLTLVYAHINRIIRRDNVDALYVVGPGHGAPGILASLWLEDSLSRFYPEITRDRVGLEKLVSGFSEPGGFPSHINAETPGAIHEGGELGYALSVAFGAVMDKPDLIAVCVVGDGEAETGPTAAAWHGHKYIDPAESGTVLPVLHVNGFKISERTIYGTMDDKELTALFSGLGYLVYFVDDMENVDQNLAATMDSALRQIKQIQNDARKGNPTVKPRWPIIILRTPKGFGAPQEVAGQYIAGSFHAHQVPLPNAKQSAEELSALQAWLESYKPTELFDKDGAPVADILNSIPDDDASKLGQKKESYAGYKPLIIREWQTHAAEKGAQASSMKATGLFLKDVVEDNPKSFRVFSPDELVSNKLDAVLDNTNRNFQSDSASRNKGGRVIEILSEHTCQGMLQGYTLTGRTGLFPSYESFLGIIHTMMVQYSKFVKIGSETNWRQPVGSLNYVETSTWARQEHNGFSHQNPSFIGAVLNLKAQMARVYLPPDANCFLSTISHCLRAKNYINLIVGSKQPTPVWLSPEEANTHCIAGVSIWKFASVDDGLNPDVVLVGIGAEVTFEVVAAAVLLRKFLPELRVRVVNVTDLMVLSTTGSHPHSVDDDAFEQLFTKDRPIHFNYHGYPIELKGLLFGRPNMGRASIEGYREEGTTTAPFDMMLCNHTSRYHVAEAAIRGGALHNPKVAVVAHEKTAYLRHLAQKDRQYLYEHGEDPEGVSDTPKFD